MTSRDGFVGRPTCWCCMLVLPASRTADALSLSLSLRVSLPAVLLLGLWVSRAVWLCTGPFASGALKRRSRFAQRAVCVWPPPHSPNSPHSTPPSLLLLNHVFRCCAVDDAGHRSGREGRYDLRRRTQHSHSGAERAVEPAQCLEFAQICCSFSRCHLSASASPADFKLVSRPVPTAGEGQVLIKVDACGVCGGDHAIKDGTVPGGQHNTRTGGEHPA